ITAALALLILAVLMNCSIALADVEKDEYGAAYVLNEDGTRNYTDVPSQDNEAGSEGAASSMYDSFNYNFEAALSGPGQEQGAQGRPEGMDEEEYARLCDNVIEWNEIGNIVEYRNPVFSKYNKQAMSSTDEMKRAYEEFRSESRNTIEGINDTIAGLQETQKILNSADSDTVVINGITVSKDTALKQLNEGLKTAVSGKQMLLSSLDSTRRNLAYSSVTVDRNLKPLKNNMTSVIEGLLISYKTLEANREMVEMQIKLFETLHAMQQSMEQQSMGTAADTQQKLNQLNTARKSLSDIDAGLEQLRKNIAVQCGYPADAAITVAELPEPDIHYLEGRDIEADRRLAVEGNSSVIAAGALSGYEQSSYGMQLRDMGENEERGRATAAFDGLYNELKRQILLYDSAQTALRKAELTEESAELKYSMGMLGNAEYEALRMQSISYRASAKLAKLNLQQAIDNYRWAMSGIMSY
ncbi:MAG: hypothetical protein Q4D40_07830, partial [Eubacteriales bacterium]|nr:hypothetical protein [Eubacteriales bacterium]